MTTLNIITTATATTAESETGCFRKKFSMLKWGGVNRNKVVAIKRRIFIIECI